jgi:hypothetical protein
VVVGRSASKTLSNQALGRLILAIRGLTLTVRGDLASRSDLLSLGVAAVTMVALLVGFSLEVEARVVMPMVAISCGVELTLVNVQKSWMISSGLIDNTPMAWLLARLRQGIPIVGVPAHPRGDDGIVSDCCSSGGLTGV